MDDLNKFFWKLYFENCSNDIIIKETFNPLREYFNEMVEGAIIDIGCGQSSFLLEFANSNREIIAVDREVQQLDFLKLRVLKEKFNQINNWTFKILDFPVDEIPQKKYALIIMSNFLHFFTLKDCQEIIENITKVTKHGTLIYVAVHEIEHYERKRQEIRGSNYFKHFFLKDELKGIFPEDLYDNIFCAQINKVAPLAEVELLNSCYDRYFEGKRSVDEINKIKKCNNLQDEQQSDLIAIFKRK